jgi:hypothetical protein
MDAGLRSIPNWEDDPFAIADLEERISMTPAVESLLSDPILSRCERAFATDGNGGVRLTARHLLLLLANRVLVRRYGDFEATFQRYWDELAHYYETETANLHVFAAVAGLQPRSRRIEFHDGLTFGGIDEFGGLRSRWWLGEFNDGDFGFAERFVVDRWKEPPANGSIQQTEVRNRANRALQALALVDGIDWSVGFPTIIHATTVGPTWLDGLRGRSIPMMEVRPASGHILNAEEEREWGERYTGLSRCDRRWLGVSLSRFADALRRPSLEDKVIDFSISAEALFLTDSRAELSYKLANRSALWIGSSGDERVDIYDRFKSLYTARSTLVHGDHLKGPLYDLATAAERDMRTALQKAVKWVAAGQSDRNHLVPNWDYALLRNEPLNPLTN